MVVYDSYSAVRVVSVQFEIIDTNTSVVWKKLHYTHVVGRLLIYGYTTRNTAKKQKSSIASHKVSFKFMLGSDIVAEVNDIRLQK